MFDALMPTSSGYSLNDIIAKGRNNMNKLLEIFLSWRGHCYVFQTHIQKMYNSVKLKESEWCFQRYLWQERLDPAYPPEENIIKTLIYGVNSSGNQPERGLRETVNIHQQQHPEVNRVINEDVYMDDCLSGENDQHKVETLTDYIEKVVTYGGYTLKGVTMSGQDPHASLSSDGIALSMAGLKWFPKEHSLFMDIKELDFAKRYRGKKIGSIKEIPKKLTRRICSSKVAEVFDMTGILTPITVTFKVDLHDLVKRKLSWDDSIPDNLHQLWVSHFEMLSEMNSIIYRRAIVPHNATSLKIDTLDFGDASQILICSAIYVRFSVPNGYSCLLIFSRSKLVPENTSMPRPELSAALLNAHTGETVRRAFKQNHVSHKFTDSQIVLHWISNEKLSLKLWVRNRVIEVKRLTNSTDWKYIKSSEMIADIGTRRNASLDIIKPESVWFNGFKWMTQEASEFPAISAKRISLDSSEFQEMKKEVSEESQTSRSHFFTVPNQVKERYIFADYLIDPNKHRYSVIIRIIAIVMSFVENLKFFTLKSSSHKKINFTAKFKQKDQPLLSTEFLEKAKQYFFRKGTLEVKQFASQSKYIHCSNEKDGILFHTG